MYRELLSEILTEVKKLKGDMTDVPHDYDNSFPPLNLNTSSILKRNKSSYYVKKYDDEEEHYGDGGIKSSTRMKGVIEYAAWSALKVMSRHIKRIRVADIMLLDFDEDYKSFFVISKMKNGYYNMTSADENSYRRMITGMFLAMTVIGNLDLHRGNIVRKNTRQFYAIDFEFSFNRIDLKDMARLQVDSIRRNYRRNLEKFVYSVTNKSDTLFSKAFKKTIEKDYYTLISIKGEVTDAVKKTFRKAEKLLINSNIEEKEKSRLLIDVDSIKRDVYRSIEHNYGVINELMKER